MLGLLFVFLGPFHLGIYIDLGFLILGILLIIVGLPLLLTTVKERRRVVYTIKGRDSASLHGISSEAGVSFERTKDHLQILIGSGILQGGIIDDMYVSSMKAEVIDSRTIRCSHCGTELELSE